MTTSALPRCRLCGRRPAVVDELDCVECRARARAEEESAPLTQTPETGRSSPGVGCPSLPADDRASLLSTAVEVGR